MYRFNKDKELMIKFISDKFVNGKRIHELLIIKDILNGEDSLLERLKITLSERGIGFDSNTKLNIYHTYSHLYLGQPRLYPTPTIYTHLSMCIYCTI